MYSHEPEGYNCPFCRIVSGSKDALTQPSDVFYHDGWVTAFIASHWWPNNVGHAIVIPNRHIENIYDLPCDISMRVHEAARQIVIAFKRLYHCDGTSLRQHNEPAGDQE